MADANDRTREPGDPTPLELLASHVTRGLIARFRVGRLLARFPERPVWAAFMPVNGFITIGILAGLAMVTRAPFAFLRSDLRLSFFSSTRHYPQRAPGTRSMGTPSASSAGTRHSGPPGSPTHPLPSRSGWTSLASWPRRSLPDRLPDDPLQSSASARGSDHAHHLARNRHQADLPPLDRGRRCPPDRPGVRHQSARGTGLSAVTKRQTVPSSRG